MRPGGIDWIRRDFIKKLSVLIEIVAAASPYLGSDQSDNIQQSRLIILSMMKNIIK